MLEKLQYKNIKKYKIYIPFDINTNSKLFFDKDSLIPYYEEQPKKLSFKKLKDDILLDPRIKTGIEH